MFFEIFQSLSLTTGAGGLFDFGATLPLVAIQFLILMFILNTICLLYTSDAADE